MNRVRLVAVAALTVSIAACVTGTGPAPRVPEVFDLDRDAAAGIAEVDPARGEVVAADQLRLLLENHLAWHGVTLVGAMRSAEHHADGEADVRSEDVTAWTDALVDSTDEITAAVGLVYGPVGARAFNQLWAQHTQFLVDYAAASGRGDIAAQTLATAKLDDYVRDSGTLFETATGGELPADTAASVLRTHVDHMLGQIDALSAGDRARAEHLVLEDHTYLFGIADALATAISAQQPVAFPGAISTPAADHVSAINHDAGIVVLRHLGSSRPITGDPFSRGTDVDPAAAAASTWREAVTGFNTATRRHDAPALVANSKALLGAADLTARASAEAVTHHHP